MDVAEQLFFFFDTVAEQLIQLSFESIDDHHDKDNTNSNRVEEEGKAE